MCETVSIEARAEASVRTMPWLVAEPRAPLREELAVDRPRGPGRAARVRLDADRTVVGRAVDCDLVLDDETVSDRHFEIAWNDTDLVLRDLESRNGTYVNGLKVTTTSVGPGVVVQIGRTRLRCTVGPEEPAALLSGGSPLLRDVTGRLARFARLDAPVLIQGESGTGKELAARALHELSSRIQGPFVAVNCAGFSPELVDSELFGHERGAFTGAFERRRGAFELAHRGTLFLDELGELPPPQQAKLLRVLEGSEIRRVGGEETTRCDARIVAATNADLEEAVGKGKFRADLYHRLAVLELRMPPLRARRDDIADLAERFLAEFAPELGPHTLASGALARLAAHAWPGNVRELRNVLYRAAATCAGSQIAPGDLEIASGARRRVPPATSTDDPERAETIRRALARQGGNISRAARDLGVARSTLRSWLARAALTMPPATRPPSSDEAGGRDLALAASPDYRTIGPRPST
ncbi:MAG: sigma 54-dependent Fis family transcriptional regulator [Deltaproteobacteria bacterium]|nr:sigma 54-dependent Fis family transcriptional regulator [Deltaproteobacteria bacterium]